MEFKKDIIDRLIIKNILLLLVVAGLISFALQVAAIFFGKPRSVFLLIQFFAIILAIIYVYERRWVNVIPFAIIYPVVGHLRYFYNIYIINGGSNLYLGEVRLMLTDAGFSILFVGAVYVYLRYAWPHLKRRKPIPGSVLVVATALFFTDSFPMVSTRLWKLNWIFKAGSPEYVFDSYQAIISVVMLSVIWNISMALSKFYLELDIKFEGAIFSCLLFVPVLVNYLIQQFIPSINIFELPEFLPAAVIPTFLMFVALALLFYLLTLAFNSLVSD